jgi:hypothetical protein
VRAAAKKHGGVNHRQGGWAGGLRVECVCRVGSVREGRMGRGILSSSTVSLMRDDVALILFYINIFDTPIFISLLSSLQVAVFRVDNDIPHRNYYVLRVIL